MPGSWFVDMESWEVDEGIWGSLTKGAWKDTKGDGELEADERPERSWELQVDEELVGFSFCFYDRSGRWALYWIWDLGELGLGGDWREDLPPCFFGIWCVPERANRHAGGGPGGFPFSANQTGTFLFGPAARFNNWACGRPLVASLY
jgi:hypothetical protein